MGTSISKGYLNMADKPAVFIGSASEGLEFARAIRALLDEDAEVTVWNECVFEPGPGGTSIETLVKIRSDFDFAIFVFTGDDWVSSRETKSIAPRDNVIFELGLFTGYLGRERSLIVRQKGAELKIPTDLAGVTIATFDWPREDKRAERALGKACDTFRRVIREQGVSPLRLQQRQDALESNLIANEKQINETTKKVEEQQALINKLVETSISVGAFRHLAGIYLLHDYKYRQNEEVGELFQREFYHLKHRGFIEPETLEFDKRLDGTNIANLARPTDLGRIYIGLRKKDIPEDWLSPDPEKRKNLRVDIARTLQLKLSW
jgi:hypothetical protein